MDWSNIHPKIIGVLHILIDIFNLAEHLGLYFIARFDHINEGTQQRFFFIMFAIRGASSFEDCCCHPVAKIICSIIIEIGEYMCYMTILPRTHSLIVVATFFLISLMILYLTNMILVVKNPFESKLMVTVNVSLTPLRILFYALLYELHVLTLFLEESSPFRGTVYEILMILNAFFGIITVYKFIEIIARIYTVKHDAKKNEEITTERMISLSWQIFVFFFNIFIGIVMMIIGLIYTYQALRNESALKAYDYTVYIILTVWYGTLLTLLVVLMIVALPLYLCGKLAVPIEKIKHVLFE